MKYFCGLLLLFGLGCSGGSSDGKIQIHGKMTFNNSPVEKGTISFLSDNGNADAGVISEGTFEARVSPGTKKVSVLAYRIAGEKKDERGLPMVIEQQFIPKNYNAETELTAEVQSDKSEFNFELTGEELAESESTEERDYKGQKTTGRRY